MTDEELFRLAQAEAQRSDDATKVGAVFVDPSTSRVLVAGHNRMPAGVDAGVAARWTRPQKYSWIEHAERNAIYAAARNGIALQGSTAALSWYPCSDCVRALVQCGVATLIARRPDEDDPKWGGDFVIARTMLQEAGVVVRYVDDGGQ